MPNHGEIVLIPVPFTDLSSQKRRPVIVISNDVYNRRSPDMVVVAMTSNPAPVPYSFTITNDELVQGALNRPGTVRIDKIYTLEQTLAVKVFGQINQATLEQIRAMLQELTVPVP
jgi:mRNA interferase MazF